MNWDLIHKYLAEECSEPERLRVEQWLEEDTRNREFFRSVSRIWSVLPRAALDSSAELELDIHDDSEWDQFKKNRLITSGDSPVLTGRGSLQQAAGIEKNEHLSYDPFSSKRKLLTRPVLYTAAAVFLLVASLVGFYSQFDFSAPEPLQQEITSNEGEYTRFRLSDGTVVTLNAGSRVVLPERFSGDQRRVFLEGEAFFEVAHDPEHPFFVEVEGAAVEVLGTKFNVKNDPASGDIQVAVVEGRVSLQSSDPVNERGIVLRKGNLGIYNLHTRDFIVENTRVENYLSWMNRRLVFENSSLVEVSRQLERLYGIECRFESEELETKRLSSNFERKDLKSVLSVIAATLRIDYSVDNNSVIWQQK